MKKHPVVLVLNGFVILIYFGRFGSLVHWKCGHTILKLEISFHLGKLASKIGMRSLLGIIIPVYP